MNISRLWKNSIVDSRMHDAFAWCAPEGGWATSLAYPYEKSGSTFHDITSCEHRRRESIAYTGVLRRMTDSSYLIRQPCIVQRTIQLFRAFIFKRWEKEIGLYRKYGIVGRTKGTGQLESREFLFPRQTKRWRWRTAELKNKFTPDYIYIYIYICSPTFRSHQALLCLVVS